MSMDIETMVRENSKEINSLAVNMSRLTQIVESGEKRYEKDAALQRDMVDGINKLNEKMATQNALQQQIMDLKEDLLEKHSDWRTTAHDVKMLIQGSGGLAVLGDKITQATALLTAITTKVDAHDTIFKEAAGAGKVSRLLWHIITAVVSGAGVAVTVYATMRSGAVGGSE